MATPSTALTDSPATTPTATPDSSPPVMNQPSTSGLQPPSPGGSLQATFLPKTQHTLLSTMKGIAMGMLEGGIPGAVAGGVDPQAPRRKALARAQAAQTAQHFADARAAHETASAAALEQQVNSFNETHQQQMEKVGLENLKAAQDAGFNLVAVSPLDGSVEDNSAAAMNNLQQIQKNNGGAVPAGLLHIHAGNANGIFTLQLSNPTAALDAINQTNRAQGLPQVTREQFMSQPATDRAVQAKNALNFTFPTDSRTGQISQDSVTTLDNRLALVKAQPDFSGKDALVTKLQQSLDFQTSALEHEAKRKGKATGTEAQAAQPGTTAAKVSEIKATSGPEAAAAGAKAEAIGKGTAKGQLEGGGGPQTDILGGTYTPPAGGFKEANKRIDSFKKDADELAKTEGTFGMFNQVLGDINAGKDMTGAQSVVALFNAIGLSATPLKGMGMRINSNTVAEHVGARGLGQSLYQRFLGLKNGDIITPQQVKDYATIAMQARHDAYVNKINEARGQGIDPAFLLPRGNGRKVDTNTAQIFYDTAAGNNPQEKAANAKKAAAAVGWQF